MTDAIVVMKQTFNGRAMQSAICFNNFSDPPTDLQEFADLIRSSYAAGPRTHLGESWSLNSIAVSLLGTDSILYTIDQPFTSGPLDGDNTAEAGVNTNCLLVSTGYTGPKPNRGRTYFTGVTENGLVGGLYNPNPRDEFVEMVEAWRDGIVTASSTHFMRILRRPSTKFPAYVSSPVETVISVNSPGTQRRRRAKT